MCNTFKKMPSIFLTHGGGPMPILGDPLHAPITKFLKGASRLLPERPKALLVVTAHWEESEPSVTTNVAPPMLYDYGGFPPESYKLKYPAPGPDQTLVERTRNLLKEGGFSNLREDLKRGYDHGTFVPLMLMFPDADIPVMQMSILSSLDPKTHCKLGEALAPLRDEGVLIIGSGSSFHNMKGFFSVMGGGSKGNTDPIIADSKAFDDWLVSTCTQYTGNDRQTRLGSWAKAPGGKQSHPREEHLMPLMVTVGAAGNDKGQAVHQCTFGASLSNGHGLPLTAFLFS